MQLWTTCHALQPEQLVSVVYANCGASHLSGLQHRREAGPDDSMAEQSDLPSTSAWPQHHSPPSLASLSLLPLSRLPRLPGAAHFHRRGVAGFWFFLFLVPSQQQHAI